MHWRRRSGSACPLPAWWTCWPHCSCRSRRSIRGPRLRPTARPEPGSYPLERPGGLADLRRQLPERRLTVFGLGCTDADVRDALLYTPRGEGVVVVSLPAVTGRHRMAALQDALVRWSPEHWVDVHLDEQGSAHLIAMAPPRTHVTFLIEKYTHEYGTSGLSINLDNLVATLTATGRASHDVVHYDQRFHEGRPVTGRRSGAATGDRRARGRGHPALPQQRQSTGRPAAAVAGQRQSGGVGMARQEDQPQHPGLLPSRRRERGSGRQRLRAAERVAELHSEEPEVLPGRPVRPATST